ncbi:kynurenine 3-monooxygenase, partial [Trichonephila inaurata madagascariensis]
EKLVTDFFKTPPSPLVSIKCNPYNVEDKVLILGDAAHAMVPFYGQGMNAGFEDCEILSEILEAYCYDLKKVLPAFTERRYQDAEAICDLAMYNYTEMRHLVTSKTFLLRKKMDDLINKFFPKAWIPLYTMVMARIYLEFLRLQKLQNTKTSAKKEFLIKTFCLTPAREISPNQIANWRLTQLLYVALQEISRCDLINVLNTN